MFFGCSCLFLVEYGQERGGGGNENMRLCFENQRSSVQRRDMESTRTNSPCPVGGGKRSAIDRAPAQIILRDVLF